MMTVAAAITLTAEELEALTGYRRPADQLAELLRQGYWRARRSVVTGSVILERAHYEAVAAGQDAARPRVRPVQAPKLRVAS